MEELYNNIKSTPSYSAKITQFLRENDIHSKHRRIIKKRFPRRRVIARYPFELLMADLIEYKFYKTQNKHYSYILLLIDCFTRRVWTVPMKNKSADCAYAAFKSIFDDLTRFPVNLVTDDGKEFFNSEVQSLFLLHGINHYSTPSKSKSKASLAERAIRTIKQRLQKIFYKNKNSRWVDSLSQVTTNYNHTPHRSIGMSPLEVTDENRNKVYNRLYPQRSLTVVCRLKQGDKVRTILEKNIFEKGYTQNWSDKIFIVNSVRQSQGVCWYTIKSLDNSILPGVYYYYQLNLVSRNDH